jgi:hypothetical protein
MDYEQFAVTTQVQGFPVQRYKVRDQPAMNLDNLIRLHISKRVQRCLRTRTPCLKAKPMAGRHARQNRNAIHGFINYLKGYERNARRLTVNYEP